MKNEKIKNIILLSIISLISSILIVIVFHLSIENNSFIKEIYYRYFYDTYGIGVILLFLSIYIITSFISIIITGLILKIKGNYKILSITFFIILLSHIFLTYYANHLTFIFWILLIFCPIYFSIILKIKL